MQIKPGETPDELVDHLRALADRYNFPTDEEKGQNIQFHLVCAFTDSELAKKLPALDLKVTTAKMLKACRTHIAIAETSMLWASDPKLSMLSTNGANTLSLTLNNSNRKHQNPRTNMHGGIAQNPVHLAELPALPRTPHANHVAKLVIGMPDAKTSPIGKRIQTRSHPDVDPMVKNKSRPTVLM